MAYQKKTWIARVGQGLNKFTDIISGKIMQLESRPDNIAAVGTPLSAENFNDLEDRIEAGITERVSKSGGVMTGPLQMGTQDANDVWHSFAAGGGYEYVLHAQNDGYMYIQQFLNGEPVQPSITIYPDGHVQTQTGLDFVQGVRDIRCQAAAGGTVATSYIITRRQ